MLVLGMEVHISSLCPQLVSLGMEKFGRISFLEKEETRNLNDCVGD